MRAIKDSWHLEFERFMFDQESSTVFKTWSAFSAVACALGRHVFFDMAFNQVYPNLYIVLVAKSAKCRKGLPINVAMEILESVDSPPFVLAEKITVEAIVARLEAAGTLKDDDTGERHDSECIISAEELNVFLGEDSFRNGTAAFLTRIFDAPNKWDKDTKGQGLEKLHNVVLNLLGASTPDWLRRSIPPDAVGGGFVSRFLFIFADRMSKIVTMPVMTAEMAQQKANLISDLNIIRNLRGQITMDDEAYSYYDKWYQSWMSGGGTFSGYQAKKHTFVQKLAMILTVCESDSLVISKKHVESAIGYLTEIEKEMVEVTSSIFVSPGGELAERVLAIIKSFEGKEVDKTTLQRRVWRFADAEALSVALNTLITAQLISAFEVDRPGGGRSKWSYSAN